MMKMKKANIEIGTETIDINDLIYVKRLFKLMIF